MTVDLPHDAMLLEKRDGGCRNGVNSGYFPGGKYAYGKTFELDAAMPGKSVALHFEGVYQNCKVYVNGKLAGSHRYGYTAFDVDISDFAESGENNIRVEVDNSLEPNCRWYSGSGLYRPVHLLIREQNHISQVHMETVQIHPAKVRVDVKTTQDSDITVDIYEGEKRVASGKPGILEVPEAKLWSAEKPFLYTILVRTDTDERVIAFGIRKLEWNAEKGLTVNGQRVLLRGGCIHHDHGVLGACEFRDAEERRIRILKENGFNAVRIAHNPASQITLETCDKLGMYVLNETFDGWYIPKTYHDYARWFSEDWKQDVTAMVESARNHPSVILYSHGNEVSETATERGTEVCRELTDFIHSLDPTRPVTAGINVLLNVYANMGLGVYKDKGDYQPKPLPRKGGYKEKKTGSAFFNAMAQKLGPLMFFMSRGRKGDKACLGAANSLDVLGLNYASSRYDEDVKKYPDRLMVGSETMVADLPYNWERVKKYPQLLGDFVWSAWDYLGEACIGDWTYHSYNGLPLLAGQGMIDITGKPLASMYFMQIVWGLRKEPFIGVRPLNHAKEAPTTGAWQFTNAIDSWSWQGYEGEKAVVEVYANSASVRLLLNGKEIANKPVKKYKTLFKLPYQPGTLTAEALDERGNVISSHSLTTAGEETVLRVTPDKMVLCANNQALCYLPIEFTDKAGNVNFSDGPAGLNLCPKNAYTKFGVPNYVDELPQDWQWGWIRKIEPFVLAKPGKGYRVYQYMTCFPAATLQAQTWNPSLIEEVGHAIGTEMIEAGVTLWLAPGLNIHRNPLCGRNFEYYSEDPYVSGVMAASVTRGAQSHPGLGVTIKHFCCNNQEDKRETVSENVPERALREIYLRGFEIAVRKSKPWAVMTSYNLVNGVHTFASNDLCTKALRNEWEYQGLVMTDWTASEKNPGEHTSCILAGNDLIMPGHPGAKKELTAALKSGQIKRSELEVAAANVLNVIFSSNVWSINE